MGVHQVGQQRLHEQNIWMTYNPSSGHGTLIRRSHCPLHPPPNTLADGLCSDRPLPPHLSG